MSTVQFRWQKIVNELRYLYTNLKYAKAMSDACGPEFQKHYEEYCARHNIDLAALNRQNQERISQMYDFDPEIPKEEPSSDATDLVPYDEENVDAEEFEKLMAEADEQKKENDIHDSFYKVFKKLAMKLHPDLQPVDLSEEQKAKNMELFKDAKEALDERRYYVLLDLAGQFDIDPPTNYKEQIKWMKKEIFAVNKIITQTQTTYNYLFAECDTDEQKDRVIASFIQQVHGINPS